MATVTIRRSKQRTTQPCMVRVKAARVQAKTAVAKKVLAHRLAKASAKGVLKAKAPVRRLRRRTWIQTPPDRARSHDNVSEKNKTTDIRGPMADDNVSEKNKMTDTRGPMIEGHDIEIEMN